MIKTPAIVTFANVKGGVGKTTLCILFANYLAMQGVRVVVIDSDPQQSISKTRRADIEKYGPELSLYDVVSLRPLTEDNMRNALSLLVEKGDHEIIIVDTPGSHTGAEITLLFTNTDVFVVPFHYDEITVTTTTPYIVAIDRLRERLRTVKQSQLFIIPNMIDARMGTRKERDKWEKTRDFLTQYGIVTPKIGVRANMQRVSTVGAIDRQHNNISDVFKLIYRHIFGTDKPMREVVLEGIQSEAYIKEMEKASAKTSEPKPPERTPTKPPEEPPPMKYPPGSEIPEAIKQEIIERRKSENSGTDNIDNK